MRIQAHAVEDSFESMGEQMSHMMEEITRRCYYRFSKSTAWEPAVNIHEAEDRLYLCVELAGLTRDEIHVEVSDQTLRILGERPIPRLPERDTPGTVHHMEINSGPFERAIELPGRADPAQIEARLDAGFLWIEIRKRPS